MSEDALSDISFLVIFLNCFISDCKSCDARNRVSTERLAVLACALNAIPRHFLAVSAFNLAAVFIASAILIELL